MMKKQKKNLPAHYNGENQGPQKSNLTFPTLFPLFPLTYNLLLLPNFLDLYVKWCGSNSPASSRQPPAARTPHLPHRAVPAGLSGADGGGLADSRQCVV